MRERGEAGLPGTYGEVWAQWFLLDRECTRDEYTKVLEIQAMRWEFLLRQKLRICNWIRIEVIDPRGLSLPETSPKETRNFIILVFPT
ncbi:hypothetical protein KM043_015409 [Ampulex compressa]|nr:hypothetical protein KM043_015409 [Ampulex compressa]